MIIGPCPYDDCTESAMREIASGALPKYERDTCAGCGRIVWVVHSRVDPIAYTEVDFLQDFVVDDENKAVVPRHPPRTPSPLDVEIAKRIADGLANQVLAELLEGNRP